LVERAQVKPKVTRQPSRRLGYPKAGWHRFLCLGSVFGRHPIGIGRDPTQSITGSQAIADLGRQRHHESLSARLQFDG
jgi:hypothetical protein